MNEGDTMNTTRKTATIRMGGCNLQVEGTQADILNLAHAMLGGVERSLYQETTEAVSFEDVERYALITLVSGARDLIEELAR